MNLIEANLNRQQTVKTDNKNLKKTCILGSAAGIACAIGGVYSMAKKGNPALKLKDLAYEEKDILLVGAGSVLGGLTAGVLADKDKKNVKMKLREANQQFFGNMVCPLGLLFLGDKLLDKININLPQVKQTGLASKLLNNCINAVPKTLMTIACLVTGMEIGNKIMNNVNNKIFKSEIKHDVKAEDYLVHADDICLTANMVLKDTKNISKFTNKVLPWTFILSGIKTGIQQDKTNQ